MLEMTYTGSHLCSHEFVLSLISLGDDIVDTRNYPAAAIKVAFCISASHSGHVAQHNWVC